MIMFWSSDSVHNSSKTIRGSCQSDPAFLFPPIRQKWVWQDWRGLAISFPKFLEKKKILKNQKTMRSIERRYKKFSKKFPEWSSYSRFAEAIRGQKFSKRTIHFWFNRLVEKDDYSENEKRKILRELGNPEPP